MIELANVSRTAASLFGLSVHWYGVLIVLGMAAGIVLCMVREKRLGLPKDTTLDIALIGIPAAILSARLYYVAFSWQSYVEGPWWKVFAVWEGGLAIYGGIIGGIFAGWLYARAKGLKLTKLLDLVAPSVPIGQAIGRWGNFINQEAHGGPVTNPALQFFPAAVQIGQEWYYATFFYESVWCFLIAAVVLIGERKRRFRKTGDAFVTYAFLYALERAVVEGLRADSLYLGGMRVSQGLSLAVVLIVAAMLAVRCKGAPTWLRIAAPACAVAAIAAAVWLSTAWVLAACVITLVSAAVLYGLENSESATEN